MLASVPGTSPLLRLRQNRAANETLVAVCKVEGVLANLWLVVTSHTLGQCITWMHHTKACHLSAVLPRCCIVWHTVFFFRGRAIRYINATKETTRAMFSSCRQTKQLVERQTKASASEAMLSSTANNIQGLLRDKHPSCQAYQFSLNKV